MLSPTLLTGETKKKQNQTNFTSTPCFCLLELNRMVP